MACGNRSGVECWGIREWRAGIGAVWNAGIRGMACGNRSGVECWDKGNGVRE